ncbi:hypothetical protein BDZ85DRAFT_266511 [Elsinoe ampelina]|uniref:Uncharacterized protein n=1 Tax=Elsinoe ampelina TaxID=302913 RepID=A0A6A6G3Y8_9PEZI|nr:hypothetical protein BDZ85DRAFT_266511 [Elsinoe ampelina]
MPHSTNYKKNNNNTSMPPEGFFPITVGVGPVMTVGEILAMYPKDHPSYRPMPDGKQPRPTSEVDMKNHQYHSIEDLVRDLNGRFDADKEEKGADAGKEDKQPGGKKEDDKPVFGPELPPGYAKNQKDAGR